MSLTKNLTKRTISGQALVTGGELSLNTSLKAPAEVYLERCRQFRQTGRHETIGELELITKCKDEYNVGLTSIDVQHIKLL